MTSYMSAVYRFSTGLSILQQLMTKTEEVIKTEEATRTEEGGKGLCSQLPLSQLWPHLIALACQYTAEDRLKVIRLLIQMLSLLRKDW